MMNGQPNSRDAQPHNSYSFNASNPAAFSNYNTVGYSVPVANMNATLQMPSQLMYSNYHQQQSSSLAAEESHPSLGNSLTITPSPSESTSSIHDGRFPVENGSKEPLFRPVDFAAQALLVSRATPSIGVAHEAKALPPTPPDSTKSSSRPSESPTNEDGKNLEPSHNLPASVGPANEQESNSCAIGNVPAPPNDAGAAESHGITLDLLEREQTLWRMFMELGNEMIVTRPGRKLFPRVIGTLRGLERSTLYNISLKISPFETPVYRYVYKNNGWNRSGLCEDKDIAEERQTFRHPDSPKTGQSWMKKPISFKQVKITHNDDLHKPDTLYVYSMHKYKIEMVVEPVGKEPVTIPIPDTAFVAVTAYQSGAITSLKITHNQYAKGHRQKMEECHHLPARNLPPLPLPSLYGTPDGQVPIWHNFPHLACRIPPIPSPSVVDTFSPQSAASHSQKQPGVLPPLPPLPTYPQPIGMPPPYPYFPPTSWPAPYLQQPDNNSES